MSCFDSTKHAYNITVSRYSEGLIMEVQQDVQDGRDSQTLCEGQQHAQQHQPSPKILAARTAQSVHAGFVLLNITCGM